jgi:hypothetical protein
VFDTTVWPTRLDLKYRAALKSCSPRDDSLAGHVAAEVKLPWLRRVNGFYRGRIQVELAMSIWTRRKFLRAAAATVPGLSCVAPHLIQAADNAGNEALPPIRQITRGPRFHWFGYYDKLQFSPDDRFVLSNQVDFEHRTPNPDDVIQIGMIDTHRADQWLALGDTRAWCWQQGCMLQWVPGSQSEIIWNDRDDESFVSHILDVKTKKKRTLPYPIYNVSPDGKSAIALSFSRLHDSRPGYGYAGIPDSYKDVPAPAEIGIWTMDMQTGIRKLLFSLADAKAIPYTGNPRMAFSDTSQHRFEHLLFNPDGSRIFLLHRWELPKDTFGTRAFTINPDGTDPFVLDPHGYTSHFIWRDPRHVMAWSWHPSHKFSFYLYTDQTDIVEQVGAGVMTENGHNTFVPASNNQLVLCDTYPDANRLQHPYLYSVPSNRKSSLGHFRSPPAYTGEWRCDTHPRNSRDGKFVCIDSPHNAGRQMYLIDISGLTKG